MTIPFACGLQTLLLLLSSLLMAKADFPNCQLGSSNKRETLALKTKDGEEAGSLTLKIDQTSGQLRFDSYSTETYQMHGQQIWFDEKEYQHEMPQDPSLFFMKDASPSGTSKRIGMWVVNPFYCGQISMILAFHSTMKRQTTAGEQEVVDVYAYNHGDSDEVDDKNEDGSIHQATFQLSCTPCEKWEAPEPGITLATRPKPFRGNDDDDDGKGGSKEDNQSISSRSRVRTRAGNWANTGLAERDDTSRSGVSSVKHYTNTGTADRPVTRHFTNTGTAERPIIDDSALAPICLADKNRQGAVCHDLVSKIWKDGGDQVVGDLCVSVNDATNLLQVTLTPLEGYSLLRGQLWTGTDGIGAMPTKEEGHPAGNTTIGIPNTNVFPNYQCTSKGTSKMRWELQMAHQCGNNSTANHHDGSLTVTVVAHAMVAPKDTDGTIISERRLDAFATQINVDTPTVRFGYMTVDLQCNTRDCGLKRGPLLLRRRQ